MSTQDALWRAKLALYACQRIDADYKIERHHPEPSESYLSACARRYRESLEHGQAALRELGYVVQLPEPAWVAGQLAVVVDS